MPALLREHLKGPRGTKGQSLVEFALTLPIMLVLLLGVVDVGFVLYAHVQVAAASWEGALVGSRISANPDPSHQTRLYNDGFRRQALQDAVVSSMGLLNTTQPTNPNFQYGSSLGLTDDTPADSDIVVTYLDNSGLASRVGEHFVVTVRYRQAVFFGFLPGVVGERFQVSSKAEARIQ